MKKIAVIGLKGLPAFGGAAAVGEALINELKEDFDITVLSVSSHTSMKSGDKYNGVKQVVFGSVYKGAINTIMYYIKCVIYVLFHNYDIVHLHHYATGIFIPILKLKAKVVITGHGMLLINDPKFSKFSNWMVNCAMGLAIKKADVVISVSQPDSIYLSQKYSKKVYYIPNGITCPASDYKNDSDKDIKNYILFAAGRIYPIKGLHYLIDALKLINYRGKLLVVGDIDRMPEYKKYIYQKLTGVNVEFTGMIKDKQKLMKIIRGANLFVFPSITEAMSMMLLEVVAQHVPVIASNIEANTSIFHGNEILFFNSEDCVDLSRKIEFALRHENVMKGMAQEAYEKLSVTYTWEAIGEQYKVLFMNL